MPDEIEAPTLLGRSFSREASMASKRCAACGAVFEPRPQRLRQTFCPAAPCQRERRRRWQRERLRSDPAYRENQERAQQAWLDQNAGYWRQYREAHPEYVERNRHLQRERDSSRRLRVLAKMDACRRETPMASGTYRLIAATGEDLAKMTAWTVQITVISDSWLPAGERAAILQREDVIASGAPSR